MPAVTRNELAFCLLVESGASLTEAWDWTQRFLEDFPKPWAVTERDVRLQIDFYRRSVRPACWYSEVVK